MCCLLPRGAHIPQPDLPIRILGFEGVLIIFSPRGGICLSALSGLVTLQSGQPHPVKERNKTNYWSLLVIDQEPIDVRGSSSPPGRL